jgi:hypothetical protein
MLKEWNTLQGETKANVKQRPKKTISLKVVDFSIWNGIKFGIGFVIGTTIGSMILMLILGGLAFLLGFSAHMMI